MQILPLRTLLGAIFGLSSLMGHADIDDLRITEVNPTTGQVEVTHDATTTFTASASIWYCIRPTYGVAFTSGTTFHPGEVKTITLAGLNASADDLWLYRDNSFGSAASIIHGLQYGAGNQGRVSVAVSAGIWPAAASFIPAPAANNSLRLIAYEVFEPASWTNNGGNDFGSFYGTGHEVGDPIPNIVATNLATSLLVIAEGLTAPLDVVDPADGTDRLFIVDQTGEVFILRNGQVEAPPFMDVSALMVNLGANYDERGLLGFALANDFPTNPRVYTYTSEPNGPAADFTVANPAGFNHQSVVTEWQLDGANPDRIAPSSRRVLMRIDQPQSNHNGGDLEVDANGLLYIALGDGGSADDEGNGHSSVGNGQDRTNVLGTILRIDPSGNNSSNGQYGIPGNNPFIGEPGTPSEIYAWGFRNPWRMNRDPVTETIWVGDVGQRDIEEVNQLTSGGNYGWRLKEGSFFFDPGASSVETLPFAPLPPSVAPVAEYDHGDGSTVVGGHVYRGNAMPALSGHYIFGDWGTFGGNFGRLFMLNEQRQIVELEVGNNQDAMNFYLLGMGRDASGELYICGRTNLGPSGSTGVVAKLIPPVAIRGVSANAGTLQLDITHDVLLVPNDVAIERATTGPSPTDDWIPQAATVITNGVQRMRATFPQPAGSRGYLRVRKD